MKAELRPEFTTVKVAVGWEFGAGVQDMPDLGGKLGKWARDLFRPVAREWMIER